MTPANDDSERRQRLETALAFYHAALAAGQPIARDVLLARYPDLADELAEYFARSDRDTRREGAVRAPPQDSTGPYLGSGSDTGTAAAPGPPAPLTICGYEVLREIGRGGMGVVYEARQAGLNRIVALKMIRAGDQAGPEERARFQAEAEAVARLQHPNIVQVYEVGEYDGRPFLALEFVAGGSLARRLAGAPQDPRQAATVVEVLAQAMQAAHERGIIHRDLKPANVLLQIADCRFEIADFKSAISNLQSAIPKITDFGLAKRLDADGGYTHTGQVLGTPSYMAPEQAAGLGKLVGPATDVYALGAILYEMLTGRPPFRGTGMAETLEQVRSQEPVPPSRLQPRVPRDLETICLKCLQKEPFRRYASTRALADDLGRFLRGEPIRARAVGRLERGWRLCRRNPLPSGLAALAILFLMSGTGIATFLAYRANDKAIEADRNAKRYRAEKRLSERHLYAAYMNLTQRLLAKAQVAAARELLDGQRPESTDGVELRGWEWYYLLRQCHAERLTLEGHRGAVRAVAVSPDGRFVASAGDDRTVRLWDAATGRLLHTLRGHSDRVNRLAFRPDGRCLASASDDTSVKLWDVDSGKEVLTYPGHVLAVKGLAFRPDGRELATAGDDCTVRVWDAATGRERLVIQTHLEANGVSQVLFSPDGTRLAAMVGNSGLRVWDAADGKLVVRRDEPAYGFFRLAYSPDGLSLAVAGDDGKIRVLDGSTGQELRAWDGHENAVEFVRFSPDGAWLVSAGGHDNLVKLWDAATGKEVRRFIGHRGAVLAVAFSGDGRRLASAGADGTVKLWDPRADPDALVLRGHQASVSGLAFSPDGRRLVSGAADHSVRIWDVVTGKEVRILGRHKVELEAPRGDRPRRPIRITTYAGHSGIVRGVALSPDGRLVASAGLDGTVRLWDADRGVEVTQFPHGGQDLRSVAFSPDGRRLAVLYRDDHIGLWDLSTRQVTLTIADPRHGLRHMAFSPDGSRLATAGGDGAVRLWDPATGQEMLALPGHRGGVSTVAFNGDGSRLASGGEDRTVRVWDLATAEEVLTCRGHGAGVDGVAFSPDGRRLASVAGEPDRTLKIWDLATGQELLTLPGAYGPVLFSPDGKRLACSGGPWGTIRIWDSNPVDNQPYRIEPARLPSSEGPSPEPGTTPVPAETVRLKVLGSYTARRLPAGRDTGRAAFVYPAKSTGRFLVIVVSAPQEHLMPSEEEYQALLARQSKAPNPPPPHPRTQTALESARRFHLVLADGRRLPGVLYARWPIRPRAGEGFTAASYTIRYHAPVGPDHRRCLAVVWDLGDGQPPFAVEIGHSGPVAVPELRLDPPLPDPRLSVRHARQRVQGGAHAAATAEATAAVADSSDAEVLYDAACVFALASAAARKDTGLAAAGREPLAERYAARAVELLGQAVANGFADAAWAHKDEDLVPLRAREDFRRLLAELDRQAKSRPPGP